MPGHYLNQTWLIVNCKKLAWNCNENITIFIQENSFENVVCNVGAIFSSLNLIYRYRYNIYICRVLKLSFYFFFARLLTLVDFHVFISMKFSYSSRLDVMEYQGSFCVCVQPIERQCYNVTSSLIGWVHTQNDPWSICDVLRKQWYWRLNDIIWETWMNWI